MEKGVFLIYPVKDIQIAALLQNFKGPKILINFQFHQFYRERRSFPWPLVCYDFLGRSVIRGRIFLNIGACEAIVVLPLLCAMFEWDGRSRV